MLSLNDGIRVFIATKPCDMRKQHVGLMCTVRLLTGTELMSGCLYVFWNAKRDLMKVLFRDGHGACLLSKRLDRRAFRIMIDGNGSAGTVEMSHGELALLLKDLTFERKNPAEKPTK